MTENVREIRVGLLAYGAIGDQHNAAVSSTEGLRLSAQLLIPILNVWKPRKR